MIQLVFAVGTEELGYPQLGDNETPNAKFIWVFPDIKKTFPIITWEGKVIIDPSYYYVTSGEALRKTEVLIGDIEEKIAEHEDIAELVEELGELLGDIILFYEILLETKGPSKYLEVTKCEDGMYSGNICARKDKKKKK